MLILGLIFGGLVIDLGGGPNHQRLGFHYWNTWRFQRIYRQRIHGKIFGVLESSLDLCLQLWERSSGCYLGLRDPKPSQDHPRRYQEGFHPWVSTL